MSALHPVGTAQPLPPGRDWLYWIALGLYFGANLATMGAMAVALVWYGQSFRPVVDWIDPEGPGYRVLAVTPAAVVVRWVELRLALPCPGRTEVALLGPGARAPIETYPFLIDASRQTFDRQYALPAGLPAGAYQLRITDIAQCNPLFPNRHVLRVPFEVGHDARP